MFLAAAPVATPDAAAGSGDPIALYDAGRYEEARAVLEAAEARGQISGPLLYRLHFCRRVAGDAKGAADALERARAALETEAPATPSLENSFYLANTYANLGRGEDARRVAAEATARFEAGSALQPSRPMEWFQLAKLYQDQGRPDDAQRHYTTALAGFPPGAFPGNVRWARRFLGERAAANSDWKAMDREYGALAAAGLAEARDLALLARARGRLGTWAGAAEAWRQAAKLDPTSADDARYAARLAETAVALGALPATAPGGEAWNRPGREQLEALMKAQAGAVQAARERAGKALAEGAVTPALRAEVEGTLRAARPLFVGAALEYSLRGFPIRETAFKEGYAVLIFQDSAWEWPE
jgi:tetratricopeptide (TPR) repeat protein